MMSAEPYKLRAREAWERAESATDLATKMLWLRSAQDWECLAAIAERQSEMHRRLTRVLFGAWIAG